MKYCIFLFLLFSAGVSSQVQIIGDGDTINDGKRRYSLHALKDKNHVRYTEYEKNGREIKHLDFYSRLKIIKAQDYSKLTASNDLIVDGENIVYNYLTDFKTVGIARIHKMGRVVSTKGFAQNGELGFSQQLKGSNQKWFFSKILPDTMITSFYCDSSCQTRTFLVESTHSGHSHNYNKNGTVNRTIRYKNFNRDGLLEQFDLSGNLLFTEKYSKGQLISCFDSLGRQIDCKQISDSLKILSYNEIQLQKVSSSKRKFRAEIVVNESGKIIKTNIKKKDSLSMVFDSLLHSIRWKHELYMGKPVSFNVNVEFIQTDTAMLNLSKDQGVNWPENHPCFLLTNSNATRPEIMPEFPGGINALQSYLITNLKYPRNSLKKNEKGKVFVRFKVCSDGELCDYKVLSGISKDLDEEAIRVVSQMPRWTPAVSHGASVSAYFILPINFDTGK